MNNNSWGVSFSSISWFDDFLKSHKNVKNFIREKDIIFRVERKIQNDKLTIILLNEYTMSVTKILKVIKEFGGVGIIVVGGHWNSYTSGAKEHAIQQELGLFNSAEIGAALYKNDYWNFHRKDRDGSPQYHIREEQ
ncbi:hypothetical protein POV95_07740 [Klebsiella variicola]|jgi:aromatic ring-opening dioxygenase catalytic subunit (LigB family)|uniref:hypothetical protein n=1 Tax=Klebsiella variicola TaxID=244366 RepID=UPI0028C5F67E|nr:hypothetical protein [Klebsiella pneumoniae]HEI9000504.1 hypothetical protein [Citrobacter koseri]